MIISSGVFCNFATMRFLFILLLPIFYQAQIYQFPVDTLYNDSTVSITTPQLPSQQFQALQVTLKQQSGTMNAECYIFQSLDAENYIALGTDTFSTFGSDTIQSYIWPLDTIVAASVRCTCVGGDTQQTSIHGTYKVKRQ